MNLSVIRIRCERVWQRCGVAIARTLRKTWDHPFLARGQTGSRFALCLLCVFVADVSFGASAIQGLPFSRTYSLDDIGYVPRGSRLNFDAFGRIAVIHDGIYAVLNDTAWTNVVDVEESARTPMTDVVHTGYGQGYYGGRASWGLAEFGADGKLHAKSLVPANPPSWTRVSFFNNVIATSEGVYFASANGVVYWDFAAKECQLYELTGGSRVFAVGNRVYVSARGAALRYVDVKEQVLRDIPGTILDRVAVDRATPFDESHALIALADGRCFLFDGKSASPWAGQTAGNFTGRIAVLERLAEGNIAVAITGKGVFILSPEGKLLTSLTGPQYQQVASIASRETGVLWMLTEDSIEKVLYGGALTSFGQRLGLTLGWPLVAKWNERIFVASEGVLYEAMSNAPGHTARFEALTPQPAGGAWALTSFGRHLLVGSAAGIFSMESDGKLQRVARVPGLRFLVLVNENLCYAIGTSQIALLKWNGEKWIEPTARIPGLRNAFGVHRTSQAVWVEMSGDGVARISLKEGALHSMVVPNEPWTEALWVNIGIVDDVAVLSTIRDQRRFFDEMTETWCERPQLVQLLRRSPRWLARVWKDGTGTLWATHSEGLVRFTPKGSDYEMDLASFDLINDRYPVLQIFPDDDIWVTASRSLHHVERAADAHPTSHAEPVLVSLKDTRRNVEVLAKRYQDEPLRLPFSQNNLMFQFFSGSYTWRRAPIYEFRLSAGDPWATLESGSLLRFASLREGAYDLEVRIVGDSATPGTPMAFKFEILPPWYLTRPAYALYGLILVLAILGVVRWSSHVARKRNRVLERVVQERTHELESTMQRLTEETRITATLAERDRLAGEIHDSVQQGLTGAILQLDTTLKLPAVSGDLHTRLSITRNMVSYARQEVQHTVWDMDSPLLESCNDLGEALGKLKTFTNSVSIVPTISVSGAPKPLPRATTHHLLRIAQEGTNNALRHAAAGRIDIQLDYEANAVSLTISDNGVGFLVDEVLSHPGHFGLGGMRGRVRKIGGELKIKSSQGGGTVIQVLVPLTNGK
ncbi:MAG: sensor histidine kinase [Opitutaceae bacterium]